GKLLFLQVGATEMADRAASPPIDWSEVFKLAGLNLSEFREAKATRPPPVFADEVHHWEHPYPPYDKASQKVMAASLVGRLVYFEVTQPWRTSSETSGQHFRGSQASRFLAIRAALWLCAIGIATGMAWRHAIQGVVDWQ